VDEIDHKAYTDKISELSLQVKQLKRANINKSKENKHLRRVIKKLKEDAAKERKPHFRNGKRGTMKNG
jgi:hypothetical protein